MGGGRNFLGHGLKVQGTILVFCIVLSTILEPTSLVHSANHSHGEHQGSYGGGTYYGMFVFGFMEVGSLDYPATLLLSPMWGLGVSFLVGWRLKPCLSEHQKKKIVASDRTLL